MNATLYKVRADLAEWHKQFQQGIEWYKQEMDKLKNENNQLKQIIMDKDKEINELKSKINAESK